MDGRERLAEGREAEVFLLPDGNVLKLLRDGFVAERLDQEATALAALASVAVDAPTPIEIVEVDGRPGLVMSRVEGVDLLASLGRQPWRGDRLIRDLAEVHHGIHQCVAPESLPTVHEEVRQRILLAPEIDETDRRRVLDLLDVLPGGDRLCHGDYHPGNVLVGPATRSVIDWGGASRGDPIADVARTAVLVGYTALPPGVGAFVRIADPLRRVLVARYLATYRQQSPIDQTLLRKWEAVWAAARLGESVPEDWPMMRRLMRKWL